MFQSFDKGNLLSEYTQWANKNALHWNWSVEKHTSFSNASMWYYTKNICKWSNEDLSNSVACFLFSCCQNPWGADLWFDKCISKNIGYTLSKKDMLQTNQKSNNKRGKSNCNREKYSQPTIIINEHRIFFEFQITLSTCKQFKIVQKVISSKASGC
jgi:hypothetical protein